MARLIKKQQKEVGLSPDALYFRGEKKIDNVLLRVIDYDSENLEETTISKLQEVLKYANKETVTWLNINGLHDLDLMKEIAQTFELDQLVLADVLDTMSRPSIQTYSNCIFLSIKMLRHNDESGDISVENLSLILTDSVLISFQEKKGDVFNPVRKRIRMKGKRIRSSGTDYLAFTLLDIVVDNYIYIISLLGDEIEDLEDEILQEPQQSIISEINSYKQELNFLRKNINPAKEMILALSKIDPDIIDDHNDVHFKELLDNISQANESSDSYREILSDQLNVYHTTISSKLNDVMKFLTIFSVVFIPLTFIAGIYGTNFEYVPELKYRYSYFIMLVVMMAVAIGMLIYFRKKKWL